MLSNLEILQYGVAVFSAMLGATYQLAWGGQQSTHTTFQRIVSFVIAVFLTMLLEALLFFKGHINWLWVAVFGLFFSLGAEHVIRLAMDYQKGAKSLLQYVIRMKKLNDLYKSGKIDLDDDSTTENETPQKP